MNFSDIEREFREKYTVTKADFTGTRGMHDGRISNIQTLWGPFNSDPQDVLSFFKAKHDAYQQWLVEEIEKKKKKEDRLFIPIHHQDVPDQDVGFIFNEALSDIQELVQGTSEENQHQGS
jgi:hypothetical protein